METPSLLDDSSVPGLGARRRARRRYFWLAVTLAAIGLMDTIVFMVWRHDKPLDNPGGPLASMGAGVVFWETSGHMLMWMAFFLLILGQYRNQRETSSK